MIEVVPKTARRVALLAILFLVLGVLVYRIGFYAPPPIVNPAYQSPVPHPAP